MGGMQIPFSAKQNQLDEQAFGVDRRWRGLQHERDPKKAEGGLISVLRIEALIPLKQSFSRYVLSANVQHLFCNCIHIGRYV